MNIEFNIRSAELSDIPELLVIGKANFEQMKFREEGNNYEEEVVQKWLERILNNNSDYIHMIAESDGKIAGYFSIIFTLRHAWHTGPRHAAELAWHARIDLDDFDKCKVLFALLDCMESVIKLRDVKWFHMGCSAKPEFKAVHECLQRKGYVDTDIVMVKEL